VTTGSRALTRGYSTWHRTEQRHQPSSNNMWDWLESDARNRGGFSSLTVALAVAATLVLSDDDDDTLPAPDEIKWSSKSTIVEKQTGFTLPTVVVLPDDKLNLLGTGARAMTIFRFLTCTLFITTVFFYPPDRNLICRWDGSVH